MANSIELKNVRVSFSTMLNKLDNRLYGRIFKVMVPMDSPELEETINQYKTLNDLAKKTYGEQLGKKLKNATSPDDVFAESTYEEGFVELKFNIYFVREKEVENEKGEKVKKLIEVLNPIYDSANFCYKKDANGKKEYELDDGKRWVPLSNNRINIKYSLSAGYNSKENKPTIQLKAEEVEIVESEWGNKSSGPKLTMLTLDGAKTAPKTKSNESEGSYTEEELAELDI